MKRIYFAGLCSFAFLLGTCAYAQKSLNPAEEASPTQPAPRQAAWWQQRHQTVLQQVKEHPDAQVVFLGDSITQNYEKTGPAPNEVFHPAWDKYFAPYGALNLGFSGDETQHLLWRIEHGELDGLSPVVCVVMIGTNNSDMHHEWTSQQNASGVEAVVSEIERRLPQTHVLLLGILPSNRSAEKSQNDAATNALLAARYHADARVTWLDLGSIFYRNGLLNIGIFYDPYLTPPGGALHPNTEGQARMAAVIAPFIDYLVSIHPATHTSTASQ